MYFSGMTPSLGLVERRGERLNEYVETIEEALHQLRRDLSLSQHLFESKLISPFHDRPPNLSDSAMEVNDARTVR
jgi:hypothetical protein